MNSIDPKRMRLNRKTYGRFGLLSCLLLQAGFYFNEGVFGLLILRIHLQGIF